MGARLATVEAVEQQAPQAPAPPAKPGRGRPKKPEPVELPLPSSRMLSPDQFFKYWASIPAEHKHRIMVYVYRHHPVIDKPKPIYIGKYQAAVPQENILRLHGAGKYGLTLTDNAQRKGGEMCKTTIEFKETEHPWDRFPPDIDPDELVMDHPDNQPYIRWLKARGPLNVQQAQGSDEALKTLVASQAQQIQTLLSNVINRKPDADASMNKLMEMFAMGNKVSLEMALSQVKQNSPEEMLKLITMLQGAFARPEGTSLKDLLEVVKFLQPKQDDSQLRFLVDELKASREQNTALLTKLIDRESRGGGIKEMLETFSLMRDAFGGEGGSRRRGNAWVDLLEPHMDKALGTLDKLASAIPLFVARKPAAPNPPAPSEEDAMRDQILQFFAQHWPTIEKFMKEARPGQALTDYLVEGGHLDGIKIQMLAMLGLPRIMQAIQDSEGWPMVQQYAPVLEKFLGEALSWTPAWNPDEEVDPPPPGPQLVPPKGA